MCRSLVIQYWSCGCTVKRRHRVPLRFIQPCIGRTENPPTCDGRLHMFDQTARIPWFCPHCHDRIVQNRFRAMYGMTGSNVSAIRTRLDQVDDAVEDARDHHARNRLNSALHSLDINILGATATFNATRDAALKAFFGDSVYDTLIWKEWAQKGQDYPFLMPYFVPYASMMIDSSLASQDFMHLPEYGDLETEPGLRRVTFPAAHRHPIGLPPAYLPPPADPGTQSHDYRSEEPFVSYGSGVDSNAPPGAQASNSSDPDSQAIAKLTLLLRLRSKLRNTLAALRSLRPTARRPPPLVNPEARRGPAFGTEASRRSSVRLVKKQINILTIFIREERVMNMALRRIRFANTRGAPAAVTTPLLDELQDIVNTILMNRYNHSISELLVPMNGTDTSKVHEVPMLGRQLARRLPPQVFGFPKHVKNQLTKYTPHPSIDLRHNSRVSRDDPNDRVDLSDEKDDVDSPDNQTRPVSRVTRTVPGRSEEVVYEPRTDPSQDRVPITQLRRFRTKPDLNTPEVVFRFVPEDGLRFFVPRSDVALSVSGLGVRSLRGDRGSHDNDTGNDDDALSTEHMNHSTSSTDHEHSTNDSANQGDVVMPDPTQRWPDSFAGRHPPVMPRLGPRDFAREGDAAWHPPVDVSAVPPNPRYYPSDPEFDLSAPSTLLRSYRASDISSSSTRTSFEPNNPSYRPSVPSTTSPSRPINTTFAPFLAPDPRYPEGTPNPWLTRATLFPSHPDPMSLYAPTSPDESRFLPLSSRPQQGQSSSSTGNIGNMLSGLQITSRDPPTGGRRRIIGPAGRALGLTDTTTVTTSAAPATTAATHPNPQIQWIHDQLRTRLRNDFVDTSPADRIIYGPLGEAYGNHARTFEEIANTYFWIAESGFRTNQTTVLNESRRMGYLIQAMGGPAHRWGEDDTYDVVRLGVGGRRIVDGDAVDAHMPSWNYPWAGDRTRRAEPRATTVVGVRPRTGGRRRRSGAGSGRVETIERGEGSGTAAARPRAASVRGVRRTLDETGFDRDEDRLGD